MKEQRQLHGKITMFSTDGTGTVGHPHAKNMNLGTDLTLLTKTTHTQTHTHIVPNPSTEFTILSP